MRVERDVDERLGVRAWDEHARVDPERPPIELPHAHEIRDGLVRTAPLHELAEARELLRGERAVPVDDELHPGLAEGEREEHVGVEPRARRPRARKSAVAQSSTLPMVHVGVVSRRVHDGGGHGRSASGAGRELGALFADDPFDLGADGVALGLAGRLEAQDEDGAGVRRSHEAPGRRSSPEGNEMPRAVDVDDLVPLGLVARGHAADDVELDGVGTVDAQLGRRERHRHVGRASRSTSACSDARISSRRSDP